MLDPPRQNWELFNKLTAESDAAWVRSLTPADRFELYCDLFDAVWNVPRDEQKWQHLEAENWQAKLAGRIRMVNAFVKLDKARS